MAANGRPAVAPVDRGAPADGVAAADVALHDVAHAESLAHEMVARIQLSDDVAPAGEGLVDDVVLACHAARERIPLLGGLGDDVIGTAGAAGGTAAPGAAGSLDPVQVPEMTARAHLSVVDFAVVQTVASASRSALLVDAAPVPRSTGCCRDRCSHAAVDDWPHESAPGIVEFDCREIHEIARAQ